MSHDRPSFNQLKTLYREWSAPLVRAFYLRDPAAAAAALELARAQIAHLKPNADLACAAGYLLNYLAYLRTRALGQPAEQQPAYFELREALELADPVGAVSHAARCLLLLIHRIRGERAGWGAVPPEEFYALFNFIPPDARDLELWHHVASWAFDHGDAELLARAYEVFVIEPSGFGNQYPFHRVKLMHATVQGTATKAEVADFCARLATENELGESRDILWPRLMQLGLIDAELEHQFAAAQLRITARSVQAQS